MLRRFLTWTRRGVVRRSPNRKLSSHLRRCPLCNVTSSPHSSDSLTGRSPISDDIRPWTALDSIGFIAIIILPFTIAPLLYIGESLLIPVAGKQHLTPCQALSNPATVGPIVAQVIALGNSLPATVVISAKIAFASAATAVGYDSLIAMRCRQSARRQETQLN